MAVTHDAIVLGAGPAGLAVARELAARGLGTAVVAPDPRAPWAPTWGAWTDTMPAWTWPAAEARFDGVVANVGREIRLNRGYLRFDTALLQAVSTERAVVAGVRLLEGKALGVAHGPSGSEVTTDRGPLGARIVIDATGAGVHLGGAGPTMFQTAVGWLAELDRPLPELRWMDFSHRHGDGREVPTFLYAIPLPDGRTFLEETSLGYPGGLPYDVLEQRLRERLQAMGVRVERVVERELCRIGLDRAVPQPGRTLGYGSAAAMVHPATGYQLARALSLAEPFAVAVAEGLASGPAEAARRGWASLWPSDRKARWSLYRFGARAVSRMGADDTRRFFGDFFRSERWGPWLDDELSLGALAGEMASLFGRSPWSVRLRLTRGWPLDAGPAARHSGMGANSPTRGDATNSWEER